MSDKWTYQMDEEGNFWIPPTRSCSNCNSFGNINLIRYAGFSVAGLLCLNCGSEILPPVREMTPELFTGI